MYYRVNFFIIDHEGKLLGIINNRVFAALRIIAQYNDLNTVPAQAPMLATIDNCIFERDFGRTIPLDRALLAKVIASLANPEGAGRPAALVIDIDLAPLPPAARNPYNLREQKKLEDALFRAAANGVALAIIDPVRNIFSAEIGESLEQWREHIKDEVKKVHGRVYFMSPYLQYDDVFLLNYPLYHLGETGVLNESMAVVGAKLACGIEPAGGNEHLPAAASGPPTVPEACKALAEYSSLHGAPEKLHAAGTSDHASQIIINPSALRLVAGHDTRFERSCNMPWRRTPPVNQWVPGDKKGKIDGRVVYLGVDVPDNDQHKIAMGTHFRDEISGVQIHAAAHLSLLTPVNPLASVLSLLVDIIAGMSAGFVFSAIWDRRNHHLVLAAGPHASFQRRAPFIKLHFSSPFSYAAATIYWWLNILFLGLFSYFGLRLSILGLKYGLWASPVPVLLGIFIHSAVESKSTLMEQAEHGWHGHAPHQPGPSSVPASDHAHGKPCPKPAAVDPRQWFLAAAVAWWIARLFMIAVIACALYLTIHSTLAH